MRWILTTFAVAFGCMTIGLAGVYAFDRVGLDEWLYNHLHKDVTERLILIGAFLGAIRGGMLAFQLEGSRMLLAFASGFYCLMLALYGYSPGIELTHPVNEYVVPMYAVALVLAGSHWIIGEFHTSRRKHQGALITSFA